MARTKKADNEKKSLQQVLDDLNKEYGKGTIISLEESDDGDGEYDVISSGSIGIDYKALGVGGFIKGKLYELRGWEGSGKSTLMGHLTAECQKKGGKVVYIDGEHAVDTKYFKNLGVNLKENFYLSQPSFGEEGFDIAERMVKSGEVDLVIIDSDSSLLPKSVIDNPVGASNIGKKAKLNSDIYPKLKIALTKSNCCVIVISQYREKIGVMFGDPKVTQGGNALRFYADAIVELSKRLVKEGEETLGNDTKFKTIKNKSFPPYRETRVDIIFGEGIDRIGELIDLSIEYGIISKSGAFYKYNEETIAKGESVIRRLLNDNPEFYEEIKGKVIEAIKSIVPLEEEQPITEKAETDE